MIRQHKLVQDERGASIVMALVFFLICAIIGSVVLTAASVSAKEVQTHKELQQAEFTVGSAAQTIGHELESIKLTCVDSQNPIPDESFLLFGTTFWKDHGAKIMEARKAHNSSTFEISVNTYKDQTNVSDAGRITEEVYGRLTVDADLAITVDLSLDSTFAASSPYNMTVTLQCIPTYDSSGNLIAFAYEPAVVKKTGDAR